MDATSDRSDVLPCCLEEDPPIRWRRFPKAELCVAGSALCGFLFATGTTMVVLHYTVESREGFHSLMEHMHIASHVLGLSFMALAGVLMLGALFVYGVWRVLEVLEMAHRYREHREFCAYEDLRHSFRSRQGSMGGSRGATVVDVGRAYSESSKGTPRK